MLSGMIVRGNWAQKRDRPPPLALLDTAQEAFPAQHIYCQPQCCGGRQSRLAGLCCIARLGAGASACVGQTLPCILMTSQASHAPVACSHPGHQEPWQSNANGSAALCICSCKALHTLLKQMINLSAYRVLCSFQRFLRVSQPGTQLGGDRP